ncbi:MAG: hypothetical protein LBF77_05695 [Spirochaetaceae bacterium]|jgi:hypothetical protein|nr:hypothetical protein [Spirochaetaceae bacterium]
MIHFILAYVKAQCRAGLVPALSRLTGALIVMALAMIISVSCDFPQGFGEGKGSLTIILPGIPAGNSAPVRNSGMAARAVHLPEEITGPMTYSLEFYPSGGGTPFTYPESGKTSEKVVTVELEPGRWAIAATAWYGSDMAALDKAEVDIQAGRENSVSFTMNADDFITPDLSGPWVNQDKYFGTGDTPPSLSVVMNTSTFFSSIPGWSDSFLYAWYYKDAAGTRTDITAADNFSGPGSTSINIMVDNSAVGTFSYYVEITNNYTYTSPGTGTTSGTAKKSIYVARVVVVSSMSYSVGDTGPGGGIIFYVDSTGFTSNGVTCHYLEAAPSDLSAVQWGKSGTFVGTTASAIGTGYANTQAIIAVLASNIPDSPSETGRAAQLAAAYNGGGLTDWFLPSQDELVALYQSGISGLSSSIWSSTEIDATTAWSVGNVGSGVSSWNDSKTGTISFRPVRAF